MSDYFATPGQADLPGTANPPTAKEIALIQRVFKFPDLFPEEFKNWLIRYIDINPPRIAAGDLTGLQGQFQVQSYTPQWTASVTAPVLNNGTLVGKYMKIGQLVVYYLELVPGSTTTFGSGQWFFTLPPFTVASLGLTQNATRGIAYDVSSGNMVPIQGDVPAGNQYTNVYYDNIGSGGVFTFPGPLAVLTATAPWTWANGDIVRINGSYISA